MPDGPKGMRRHQVTRLTPLMMHALGRMRTCLHMHACMPDEDWREGEGPCRSMIKCQARHEIMDDTTPMGPNMVNGWTYLRNVTAACMHVESQGVGRWVGETELVNARGPSPAYSLPVTHAGNGAFQKLKPKKGPVRLS